MNIQLLLIIIALALPRISFAAEPKPILQVPAYSPSINQQIFAKMIREEADSESLAALLHVAATQNDVATMKLILASKKVGPDASCRSHVGMTPSPLINACVRRQTEAAACLVDHKANLETLDPFGRTPLLLSALAGDVPTTKLLLDAKANVFAKDGFGTNALTMNIAGARGTCAEEILRAMALQACAKQAEERKAPAKSAPK